MASVVNFQQDLVMYFQKEGFSRTYSKDELMLQAGQIENHLYLIESGAIRIFWLSEHEEISIRFGYKGSVLNSLASYLRQTPSDFYVEALRKTEVLILSRQQLNAFIHRNEAYQKGYTEFLEQAFAQQIDREIDLLTASPADRLARVLRRSPTLFQEVPLKHIASYLRMTPETLSRIRKS